MDVGDPHVLLRLIVASEVTQPALHAVLAVARVRSVIRESHELKAPPQHQAVPVQLCLGHLRDLDLAGDLGYRVVPLLVGDADLHVPPLLPDYRGDSEADRVVDRGGAAEAAALSDDYPQVVREVGPAILPQEGNHVLVYLIHVLTVVVSALLEHHHRPAGVAELLRQHSPRRARADDAHVSALEHVSLDSLVALFPVLVVVCAVDGVQVGSSALSQRVTWKCAVLRGSSGTWMPSYPPSLTISSL